MKPVIVRFAGAPDAVVRRRAIQLGQNLGAGQRVSQLLGGYIISVTGQQARSVALCVELGVEAVVLFGNFLLNDMFTGYFARVRLPSYRRLVDGGDALPPTVPPTVPPAQPGDVSPSRVPDAKGPKAYVAGYWSQPIEGGFSWAYVPTIRTFFWSQSSVEADGVVHSASAPMPFLGEDAAQQLPDTAWMGQARFVWSQAHVRYLSLKNPRGVSFTDGWLSHVLGPDHYLNGRGISSNYYYTPQNSFQDETVWRALGPTPLPRFYGDDPGDGLLVVTNPYPHQITRDNAGALVQPCYPLGYPIEDGGLLVAVTCIETKPSDYLLYLERTDAPAAQGYISTHSLIANWGATAPCFSPLPGVPKLALLRFDPALLTDLERERVLAPIQEHEQDERRVFMSNGVAAYTIQSVDAVPPVDRAVPKFAAASAVTLFDLPAWAHPMRMTEWRDMYIAALESSDTLQDTVRITSDNYMPAAFGTPKQTVVDGVVEYVFAVRSRAGSLVPINRSRRAAPDEILPGEVAAVTVTKTGLAVVRATVSGAVLSTDFLYPDVVGPDDCTQFDGGVMDPLVARVPQVKFSAVMGGRRVYVCRAVRYARTPFLSSLMGAEGTMRRTTYTSGYSGRKDDAVGGPTFYTDKAFGAYPDQSQYEETWVVVDGVRHIIDTVALGGFLEPFTDRKHPHGLELRYTNSSVMAHPYFVHMRGMWQDADEQNRVLMDYMAEEFAPSGYEIANIAQVSDTDIMFALCPMFRSDVAGSLSYTICRHNIVTQQTTVVHQGIGEWPAGWALPKALDWAPALTCYQREVLDEAGNVRTPAHLLLRVGYNTRGAVSTSLDGGVTWSMLYSSDATKQLSTNGSAVAENGTPGLGLHILGRIGAAAKFQYVIDAGG